MKYKNILVTGAAGFIGFDFVQLLSEDETITIHVIDSLTYAANENNWNLLDKNSKIFKYKISINDEEILKIAQNNNIDCIVNFAAESHVDNSIETPQIFYKTNIMGTINLLEISKKLNIRFHQVSTDEVYGELKLNSTKKFEIYTPLDPSSPYSSSKAGADLAVISYGKTYNLDYTVSRCGNNYGPGQHKEKLIPHSINLLLTGNKIEIYGDGRNVRDWIYVRDHNFAILQILNVDNHKSRIYNIGSENEISNLNIAKIICENLKLNFDDNVKFIDDRKGHDKRYAINPKSMYAIGWMHKTKFSIGIKKTIFNILNKEKPKKLCKNN